MASKGLKAKAGADLEELFHSRHIDLFISDEDPEIKHLVGNRKQDVYGFHAILENKRAHHGEPDSLACCDIIVSVTEKRTIGMVNALAYYAVLPLHWMVPKDVLSGGISAIEKKLQSVRQEFEDGDRRMYLQHHQTGTMISLLHQDMMYSYGSNKVHSQLKFASDILLVKIDMDILSKTSQKDTIPWCMLGLKTLGDETYPIRGLVKIDLPLKLRNLSKERLWVYLDGTKGQALPVEDIISPEEHENGYLQFITITTEKM